MLVPRTRVLYVIDSLAPGGAETSLVAMAPGLRDHGIDLHVLPLGTRHDLAVALVDGGATVHQQTGPQGRVRNVRRVVDVGRRTRPHLVHTTLFEADVAGRTAARLLRVPVTSSLVADAYAPAHYAEHHRAKLRAAQTLDAATARFASRFHALTAAIADSVAPRLGIPADRVEVIPRGRDPETHPFRPARWRAAVRSELDLHETTPVVLAVGRLDPPKGLAELLAALPLLVRTQPDLEVLVAGKDGLASEALRATVREQSLPVTFLGHREDVPRLLAAADVLVMPSLREGMGGVLLEAMAAGCPIVASSIPTSREVLANGECGRLAPVGDPAALAHAVAETLGERGTTTERVRRARARFDADYSIAGVNARMAHFFQLQARRG